MKRWSGVLAGVLVWSFLVAPAPTAEAVSGLWTITEFDGTATAILRADGVASLSASCGSGKTAVSGYVTASAPDDVRRMKESFGAGLGGTYQVTVVDQTGAAGTINVQAHVRCVPTTYFSNHFTTAEGSFSVNDTSHLAEGTVNCPLGWRALGATTAPGGTTVGSTLLTSSPTAQLTGWEVRGWHQTVSESYKLTVHCVPAEDVTALRSVVHFDSLGWGAGATAECGSGMKPINGGTVQVGGDSQAITSYPRPTATGWASTTLSLTTTGSMQTTVVCVPSSSPTMQISPLYHVTSSRSVSWAFAATDPAASGGYAISYQCSFQHVGQLSGPTPCSSPQSFSDLADGYHAISVVATTSDGRTATTGTSLVVDTVPPTVVFDDPGGTAHPTATPVLGFTVGDATTFVDTLSCAVDGGAPGACGAPSGDYRGHRSFTVPPTTDGGHVLHVSATDQADHQTTADLPFVVDTVAPVVTMSKPATAFQLALATTAAWTGQETGSGSADFSVRWRRAPYNGTFGAWSTPVTVAGSTTSRSFGSLLPGSTYCYSADARDLAGNASAWATPRCTAVPLDDRALTRTGTWTASTPSGWFRTTALSTKSLGARLSRSGAIVKRVNLTALACPSCGVVGVYVGSTRIGTINLASSTTQRRTWNLPTFTLRTGTVSVRVLSSGKLVRIDALGLSRM